jgi:hypothetical protein
MLNIKDQIKGSIDKLMRRDEMTKYVREMFCGFARSIYGKVMSGKVGSLEENENIASVMSDNDVRKMLIEKMKKEEIEPREMLEIDAWHVKNYSVQEILKYLEEHKLTITKNNREKIKIALKEKFIGIEKFVRENKDKIKIQFCLLEDLLPKVELSKKKEISVEF